VFPTGFELKQGLIEDTNTPYLKKLLEERGYTVTVGEIMEDSTEDVYEKLDEALSRGYGLILTTGGVGAEDKDHTVEGIMMLDRQAATPYIVKFQQGTGRHVKDGVRIGVGREGPSLMVSLPGPHDEVEAAAPVLIRGLEEEWPKEVLAERLASVLADKWRRKGLGHHHNHGNE
jgi:molybdenum cofactor synthesis domain-containing protein